MLNSAAIPRPDDISLAPGDLVLFTGPGITETTTMRFEIAVTYNEDRLRAEFFCPICQEHWEFPFPARKILKQPFPSPATVVTLHLYGSAWHTEYCQGFDPFLFAPSIESTEETKATLDLEAMPSANRKRAGK
jgi:hypothetical protein